MSSGTRLAVVIVSSEEPLGEQLAAARAEGADLAELRVDLIGDAGAVEEVLKAQRALPVIVTVRSAAEGGTWSDDEPARLRMIERLARLRPEYVDIELATWQGAEHVRQTLLALRGAGAQSRPRLILSRHDLEHTPAGPEAHFEQLAASPADVVKAVFTAGDATDTCRLLAALRGCARVRPAIGLAMGAPGVASRLLAGKFGGFLTFASLRSGHESAAGQPAIRELRELYRWDDIGAATQVFGVAGWPVTHSQSPLIHNAAMTAGGVDGVYVPLPVCPEYEAFERFMDTIAGGELDIAGLSVTIPHKEHALRWLRTHGHSAADLACRCGAVNTLTRRADGTWQGDNTDAHAAVEALQPAIRAAGGAALRGRPVAILGAGGVARAVVVALREQQCEVTVYNRTARRAEQLARELGCRWQPWNQRQRYAGDVLINCTSLGLWPDVDQSPLPDDALRPETLVLDTVYRPAQTRLLRAAQARGCRTASGVDMFIAQAAVQYALWHGCRPDVGVMRSALRH